MSHRQSPSVRSPRGRRGSAKVLAVIAMAVLIIAGSLGWALYIRADERGAMDRHSELLGSITGLARPTKNSLAPAFKDADGDLVADAPADAAAQADPDEIRFTYVASPENTAALEATFKPLVDAIAASTGKRVRYVAMTDVDAQLHALRDGRLHLCAFNTGSVPLAVDVAGFVPVALLGGESGPSTYQLKVIASSKSGVQDMNGLRGRELALTEMSSNSGFKAPLVLLQRKFEMRPGFDFGIRYSLGHAQSIEGLADGTFEVIAVASDMLARAERAGTIKPDQYRVLYTSDPFPTACFGYAHSLKPELASKLRDALLNARFAGGEAAAYFAASGQTQLVKCDYAKDFALVREIDEQIGFEHKLRPATRPASEDAATTPATSPAAP